MAAQQKISLYVRRWGTPKITPANPKKATRTRHHLHDPLPPRR